MKADVLLGLQWGDEGKGKIVDVLTPNYNVIARFQGGPNAGHTLIFDGKKHVLHTIPSGIFRDNTLNVVGNGVVIDPVIFKKEIDALVERGVNPTKSLVISRKAHLIMPTHGLLDAASEQAKGKAKIGSTLKGIGPTYMDKTGRNGLRVGDLESPHFNDRYEVLKQKHIRMLKQYPEYSYDLSLYEGAWLSALEELKNFKLIDSEHVLNNVLNEGECILAEGAQGTMLDIDFGTYPFVTSSNTITAGACTGLGVPPNKIGEVFGIFKAYCTRVGSGPFPTELDNATGEKLRKAGMEFGATTGRPRRCGWLDLPQLKYAVMVNGVTQLCMMKADVLGEFDEVQVCTHYMHNGEKIDYLPYGINPDEVQPIYETLEGWPGDLTRLRKNENIPASLISYVKMIEEVVGVKVSILSVGPDREQTLLLNPKLA
ncbi:MAG: adenylosuccinate synthase [Crocinitomicaceae bacterium]|nr:adenylosuccinate synthase [Crocinitomicaceae bacterium]|tara:strand:- start:14303 stop:15586 length:1284 start_codon:yes stop_codon:yes gene_type:complete